jgi:hypothetical protein
MDARGEAVQGGQERLDPIQFYGFRGRVRQHLAHEFRIPGVILDQQHI